MRRFVESPWLVGRRAIDITPLTWFKVDPSAAISHANDPISHTYVTASICTELVKVGPDLLEQHQCSPPFTPAAEGGRVGGHARGTLRSRRGLGGQFSNC